MFHPLLLQTLTAKKQVADWSFPKGHYLCKIAGYNPWVKSSPFHDDIKRVKENERIAKLLADYHARYEKYPRLKSKQLMKERNDDFIEVLLPKFKDYFPIPEREFIPLQFPVSSAIEENTKHNYHQTDVNVSLAWITMFTNISDHTGYPNQPPVNHRSIDFDSITKPGATTISLSDFIRGQTPKHSFKTDTNVIKILPYERMKKENFPKAKNYVNPQLQLSLTGVNFREDIYHLRQKNVYCSLTFDSLFTEDLRRLGLTIAEEDKSKSPLQKIQALLSYLSGFSLATTEDVRAFCLVHGIPFYPVEDMPANLARAGLHRWFNDNLNFRLASVEGAHRVFSALMELEGMTQDQKWPVKYIADLASILNEKSPVFEIIRMHLVVPSRVEIKSGKATFLKESDCVKFRKVGEEITESQDNAIKRSQSHFCALLVRKALVEIENGNLPLIPTEFWQRTSPLKTQQRRTPTKRKAKKIQLHWVHQKVLVQVLKRDQVNLQGSCNGVEYGRNGLLKLASLIANHFLHDFFTSHRTRKSSLEMAMICWLILHFWRQLGKGIMVSIWNIRSRRHSMKTSVLQ